MQFSPIFSIIFSLFFTILIILNSKIHFSVNTEQFKIPTTTNITNSALKIYSAQIYFIIIGLIICEILLYIFLNIDFKRKFLNINFIKTIRNEFELIALIKKVNKLKNVDPYVTFKQIIYNFLRPIISIYLTIISTIINIKISLFCAILIYLFILTGIYNRKSKKISPSECKTLLRKLTLKPTDLKIEFINNKLKIIYKNKIDSFRFKPISLQIDNKENLISYEYKLDALLLFSYLKDNQNTDNIVLQIPKYNFFSLYKNYIKDFSELENRAKNYFKNRTIFIEHNDFKDFNHFFKIFFKIEEDISQIFNILETINLKTNIITNIYTESSITYLLSRFKNIIKKDKFKDILLSKKIFIDKRVEKFKQRYNLNPNQIKMYKFFLITELFLIPLYLNFEDKINYVFLHLALCKTNLIRNTIVMSPIREKKDTIDVIDIILLK